jgi:hypothetical protein
MRGKEPGMRRCVLVGGAVLILAGCAAAPPTSSDGLTAAPSSTEGIAAGSPSATPSEVAPMVVPNLVASGALGCDITGDVTGFPLRLYGRFDVNNTDDHVLVAQAGPGPFVYEQRTIGATVWDRSNGDEWGPAAGSADAVGHLRRSIDQASGWTDLGAPTNARSVHRFKATGAPVSAADFGLEMADSDQSLALEIETSADGSPVAMHIRGDALTADLTCENRPVPRPTTPPDSKRVELSQGVSLAVPETWSVDRSDPEKLTVAGPDSEWITVQGATAKGLSLEDWTKDGAAYFAREWQATPGTASITTVADEPAILSSWHLPIDGSSTSFLDVSTVRDGWGYDIEFFSQGGREPAERALFEQILTTVTFGKR